MNEFLDRLQFSYNRIKVQEQIHANDPQKHLKLHKFIRNHIKDMFQLIRNTVGSEMF